MLLENLECIDRQLLSIHAPLNGLASAIDGLSSKLEDQMEVASAGAFIPCGSKPRPYAAWH
jgi:hypothetical protein